MDKYRCICGCIYDPANGDPKADIPAGVPFDDLPENWVCPVREAEKSRFRKMG